MHILSTITLWFILFVFLGRFQEIFSFLSPLQLGKVSVGIGLCVVLSQNAQSLSLLLRKSPIKTPLIIMVALAVLGIPFSVHPSKALEECIMFLQLMLTASIIVALGKQHMQNMQMGITCVLLFVSTQMLLSKATGRIAVSRTYDPNDIALLCITFLPLTVDLISQKGFLTKLVALAASGCAVASIALTGSRGGFISMLAVALYAVIVAKKRRMLLIVLIALGGTIFVSMAGAELWDRLQSLRDGTDYNFDAGGGRMFIWESALELVIRRPIFGVGIGQFVTGLGTLTNAPWKAAHNTFIEIAADLGVGGIYAFLAILLFIYRLSLRGGQSEALSEKERNIYSYLRLSLLGYCVGSFFLSQAYSTITYTLFCFATVMFFRLEKKEKEYEAAQNADLSLEDVHTTPPKALVPQHTLAPEPLSVKPKYKPAHDLQKAGLAAAPCPQRQAQWEQAEAQRKVKKSRLEAGDMLIKKKTRA